MFEDLKVSEWWFIGLAALAGFFVVKHFLEKLPGNQADPQPGAQTSSNSGQRENSAPKDDFKGFEQKAGPGEQTNWFRREEEEAARRAEQEATAKAASASASCNPTPKPWHQVLEVSSAANIDDIKQAYKRKIRQYHPDKVAGLGPEFTTIAEAKAKEINEAYKKACATRNV